MMYDIIELHRIGKPLFDQADHPSAKCFLYSVYMQNLS